MWALRSGAVRQPDETGEQGEGEKPEGEISEGHDDAPAQTRPSALTRMSISLMPTNGAISPPTP